MRNPHARPRGGLKNPKPLGWKVESANKDYFAQLAEKSGYSAASFFDLMIETLELDERGLPTWVPRKNDEGQLPINSH